MPTYDFICESCDKVFELSISIKDYDKNGKYDCPTCGSNEKVRRSYTAPGISFGAGFFRDGYRSAKDVSRSNDD